MTFKKSVGPQKSGSEFGHVRPNRTCSQHWSGQWVRRVISESDGDMVITEGEGEGDDEGDH